MGSKAQQTSRIPGPPTFLESAYLAGLIDRGGGFTLNPVGLKIRCSKHTAKWLQTRYGGHIYVYPTRWWLTTHAELRVALERSCRYMVERGVEAFAMLDLLDYLMDADRPWHGSPEWRRRRDELIGAVRESGRARQRVRN